MAPRRTGVLTLRAWLEDDPASPLRVRIRHTRDVSAGVETVVTFADVADVLAAVQRWLADVQALEDVETLPSAAPGEAPATVHVHVPEG